MTSAAEQAARRTLPFIRWMTAYTPIKVFRWLEKLDLGKAQLPAGVRHEPLSVDGVACEWLIPDKHEPQQVLFYLHGGGFVFGWTNVHRKLVAELARKLGMRALAVDYRLAPEHPFPAALSDCVTAYRWLLKQGIAPQNIAIAGDSSGGNLTLTTMLKLREDGDPLPAAAVCMSPATNLTERDEFFKDDFDAMLHPRATTFFRLSYIGKGDPKNPLISPHFADLRGLPPLLIHAGEEEFLVYDAKQLESAAKQVGVDVRLEIYPRMWHVWQINLEMPSTKESLEDITQFIKAQIGEAIRHP